MSLYPKPIQTLVDLFTKLPGIGPRQATRFVFYILKNGYQNELAAALEELRRVEFCTHCYRTTERGHGRDNRCNFCADLRRDRTLITVVEKETDMQNFEKTGAYQGHYHILGGIISPLDSESPKRLHLKELFMRIKKLLEEEGKCELILATNPTTEGDTTALYIERVFAPLKERFASFKISRLGRGLSLGSELEYADEITLKNALVNRK